MRNGFKQFQRFFVACLGMVTCVIAGAARGQTPALPPGVGETDGYADRPVTYVAPCSIVESGTYGDRGVHASNLWPGGVVAYNFEADVAAANQQATLDAMAEITAIANVTFVVRTTETAFITFRNSTGNSSSVGRTGGNQFINMFNWNVRFIIVHEMMHALGVWHEQQRADRDQYISINTAKIQAGYENNFTIRTTGTVNGPYDFDSVMHYGSTGFSTTGDRTIKVNPQYGFAWQYSIGQRSRMSNGDKWVLASLYGGNPPARNFALSTPAVGALVGTAWAPAFTWTSSEGATSYRLRVDDDPLFGTPAIDATVATNSYSQVVPLAAGKVYYWTVTSSNARGTGDPYPLKSRTFFTGVGVPSIVYVDDSAPAGGTGASWGSAYRDLQDALLLAAGVPGGVSEIRAGQGTYKPNQGTTDRARTFRLVNGVAVKGGYAGFGAANPDARDPAVYLSTLSGDISGNDGANFAGNGENSYNVVTGSFVDATASLDGFTIRGGNATSGTFPNSRGAGVLIDNGSPVISNCTITSCSTNYAGGGLAAAFGGTPRVSFTRFTSNRSLGSGSTGQGGGAHSRFDSDAIFHGCEFVTNTAEEGAGGASLDASPQYLSCVFRSNTASIAGGALYGEAPGVLDVINCSVVGNTAPAAHAAIESAGNTAVNIFNSILWANTPAQFLATVLSVQHSDVQGGAPGASNINTDPMFTNQAGGDLRLAAGSLAIDAGNNGLMPDGYALDLGRLPRFTEDPGAPNTGVGTGAIVDMGAHERRPVCIADIDDGSGTGTPDGGVGIEDLLHYLSLYDSGVAAADVDDGSGTGTLDGGVGIEDLLYFLLRFAGGC